MKFVKLITSAYVGGVLRHPHEGVLHIEDDEAKRLVGDKVAEDVSDDFTAKQDRDAPAEQTTGPAVENAGEAQPANPHQAEVAPQAEEPAKPARRRSASQE